MLRNKILTLLPTVCFILTKNYILASASHNDQKDILFILIDDLGYNDLGFTNPKILTPNIDQLHKKSHEIKNYYVQPVCTPTRSTLMTGRYQIHTGLQHDHIHVTQPNSIPLNEKLLPEYLKDSCGSSNNFETLLVGKWHNGFYRKEATPLYRGFDKFYGFFAGSEDYFSKKVCDRPRKDLQYCGTDFQIRGGASNDTFGRYSDEVFTDYLMSYYQDLYQKRREGDSNQRSFVLLAFQSVHVPNQIPTIDFLNFEEYYSKHLKITDKKRLNHLIKVSYMDHYLGKLLDKIDLENTIIIFSSDNGGETITGGNNYPYRGKKHTYFEGGLKSANFIYPKELVGQRFRRNKKFYSDQNMFHVSDWLPTILSLASCDNIDGINRNGDRNIHKPLDGIDQTQFSRSSILYNIDELDRADSFSKKDYLFEKMMSKISNFDVRVKSSIRLDDFKIITGFCPFTERVKPDEDKTINFIANNNDNNQNDQDLNIRLYNIKVDPTESQNLNLGFETDKETLSIMLRLLKELARYNETAVPVRFPALDVDARPNADGFWGPWR